MKVFAQHWARTGGKNGTESAMVAGANTRDHAGVLSARWLRMPQVQQYIASLGTRAKELLAARKRVDGLVDETALVMADAALAEQADLTRHALDLAGVISALSEEAEVDMADFMRLEPIFDTVMEDALDAKGKPVRTPKLGADGLPLRVPRLGPSGEQETRAVWDIEKAIKNGKAKFISELKPTLYGWALRLVDRQAAKVALAKIYQTITEQRSKGDDTEASVRAWGAVADALRSRPPDQLREMYLSHIAGKPIDVPARVVKDNGNGDGEHDQA
jgi:hypothetical protein